MPNKENNVSKDKKTTVLYFVASALFFIAALVNYFASDDTAMTVIWICLGSCFSCLGSVNMNKNGSDDSNGDRD